MVDKTWIMTEDGLKEWIPVKDSLLIPAETEMTDTIEVQ
jgi:hypothetical protein